MDDSASDFHTLNEAEYAISKLQSVEIIKLRRFARSRLVFNSRELSEYELISEALSRTLNGRRRWNKKLNIFQHLIGVMKSISNDQRRTKASKKEVFSEELREDRKQEIDQLDNAQDISFLIEYEEILSTIFNEFKTDKISLEILNCLLEGSTRSEIVLKLDLSKHEYDAAKKRITRRILQMKERGQI